MKNDFGDIVLERTPKYTKYTSPTISIEILHIITNRVRRKIYEEVGDAKFSIFWLMNPKIQQIKKRRPLF